MTTKIEKCRICDSAKMDTVLDLYSQKIANGFHDMLTKQPEAPLHLVRCPKCSLVQLAHAVDTDAMYRKYWYRSSVNQTMRDHLKGIVAEITSKIELEERDIVIDIGCNDGTLLSYYEEDVVRIGVDPSNITPNNCAFINDYFSFQNVAEVLDGRKAKVITSIAMFYDLNDPKAFVQDIRKCLRDDGLWVLELSYLPRMIANAAYDSICHEHVAYYSMSTFLKTIDGSGLSIVHASFNDMNGGSFRLHLTPAGKEAEIVRETVEKEREVGYDKDDVYADFVNRVSTSRDKLIRFFYDNQRAKIYGYGASTKGQIILQYCGFGCGLVAIADRNPLKHGLYTPGSNVRICSEEEMRTARPDYLVMFPWYFFEEFEKREADLHSMGCKFVLPLPDFRIC